MRHIIIRTLWILGAAGLLWGQAGCDSVQSVPPKTYDQTHKKASLPAITLYSSEAQEKAQSQQEQQKRLWQAGLDQIRDYPLVVSDYQGGVLSTDWRQTTPGERHKLTLRFQWELLGKPQALQVRAFQQIQQQGQWLDQTPTPALQDQASQIQTRILQTLAPAQ